MGDGPALLIEPVVAVLPAGFARLQAEAAAEGYRHLDRLAAEWEARALRFDRPGEALLAGFCGGELAAIGGLTLDPYQPDALRMRRFYVRPVSRGRGIGGSLAQRLLAHAAGRTVTVNAAAGSEAFWAALGFLPEIGNNHTHVLAASAGNASS